MVYLMVLPFSHYWKSVAQFMNHVQSAETPPGDVPTVLTATSGVSSAFLSTLIPEASRLGLRPGPVPRDEMEQGLGLDAFGPSWSGYILAPLTLAMSQSVSCPLAK